MLLTTVVSAQDGGWNVEERADPITDEVNVFSTLRSDAGEEALVVRCMENVTSVMLIWGEYLGSENSSAVTTRIDRQEPQTRSWPMLTSSTGHMRSGQAGISFARQLLQADRLVARTTPYRESPVTALFDLAGVEAALDAVSTACDW